MSFETLYPGAANLIGNVAIPRNVNPTIRASSRRLNPDLVSSAPYYDAATGKTLRLNYTKEVSTVVTPITINITLTGTSMASVITDINAADASNIQAFDVDGFLLLKNLNPGKTHFLTVAPFSTPANDAAPILGFEVDPFPGSTSFAGEIASAPGSRSQKNPQTTTLLARDDSLGTEELNRGFVSVLQMLEDLRVELSRDVVVYKSVRLPFILHNTSTTPVPAARINDDSLRLFYPFPDEDPPSGINPKELSPYYRALDNVGLGEDVVNFGAGTTDASALVVTNLYYATNLTDFTDNAFVTWGTPDGGTIISSTTANKTKHPSTSIASIKGNIVTCSSATFVTHKVKTGDPVKLTASNLQPFDHSGWFAVDAVIDETHIAVRSMASKEEIPDGTNVRPRWLNPVAGGTLRVAVGRFVPAGDIYVTINAASAPADHVIHISVGVPFIQTINEDRARDLSGNLSRLGLVLQTHLGHFPDQHGAADITGFTSGTSWRDSTTISGVSLQTTIEDILTDLKAQATSNSGTGRIGAEVITIGGSTPNTLAQGTVLTQLTALLTALQTHVNQTSGAHPATAISYAGGPNWADATTNPATTVEGQLDKIVTDLGGAGGASKVKYDGGPTWADATTNPATTVEGQLDKVVTDLAATTGSAKIGGVATGSDIAAGTVAAQIANLAVNWLKMARANVISAAQTFTSLITANGGLTAGIDQNITVSGTGDLKHGDRQLSLSVMGGSGVQGTWALQEALGPAFFMKAVLTATTGTDEFAVYLPLKAGDRIKTVIGYYKPNVNGTYTFKVRQVQLSTFTGSGGSIPPSTIVATGNGIISGGGFFSVTISSINYVILANGYCQLEFFPAAGNLSELYGYDVVYDRP